MQAESEALTVEALKHCQKQILTGLFGYIKTNFQKATVERTRHGHVIVKPSLLSFKLVAGHNPKKRPPYPGLLRYPENKG